METIKAVTEHLRARVARRRGALRLIPTKAGKDWLVDDADEYWRMYPFISDSTCFQKAEKSGDLRESGTAFGDFQCHLADFDADSLSETIPRFHDTPNRYAQFKAALKADPVGRARHIQKEIDFALAREGYASTLTDLLRAGEIPLRVTHNDTKLSNVLFDRETRRALCVVDLDTVMPGLSVYDFGDSIRFGASTALEDEPDLSKVSFSLTLYEAYADGFLQACEKALTPCELQHLPDGARMLTLEQGLRFLTDYIEGDVYYRVRRDGQNLDRCRTQFKLVEEMEKHWEQMKSIINK
jgi:Ser/Thr protein kinase RdoA (MazF antagonist)